ncbi:MAG: hypothetical protein ACK4YM_03300 [Novosphingobium sp.]
MIGRDRIKSRALMPLAVAEQLASALPALALFAGGYPVAPAVAAVAGIALRLGLGFLLAWRRILSAGQPISRPADLSPGCHCASAA